MRRKKFKGKTSDEVWIYVKQYPYVQASLERGIVNYSALARIINKRLHVSEEAIKAALIRIGHKLRKKRIQSERKIMKVMRETTMEIKHKVAVIIARKKLNIESLSSSQSPSGFTYIVEESHLGKIKKKGIIKIEKNLDVVTLIHPPDIEKVSGVIDFLIYNLAAENINIPHIFSCYHDTLLVISNTDTARTFEILSEKLK